MKVRFWGTRGSMPASSKAEDIRLKIRTALETALRRGLSLEEDIEAFIDDELPFWVRGTYGVNTPCIEISEGREMILCDAGSGLREFGNHCLGKGPEDAPMDFHILISHPHWDHIQGFPFFTPAYLAGRRVSIYGCHESLRNAFVLQQSSPFFPVEFKSLGADIDFVPLTPGQSRRIAGFDVTAKQQKHPGLSYGYRLERGGKSVVYATDSEHKGEGDKEAAAFQDFFNGADLLIYDAQYTFAEANTVKKDWGHSNNLVGVELARQAGVRHLCLFHHEPTSNDRDLDRLLRDTKKLAIMMGGAAPLEVSVARDNMTITL